MAKAAQSARGLFDATGNKRKDVVVRDLVSGELVKSKDGIQRHPDDFQPTPPEPTLALLAAELERIKSFDQVWEPACGDGAMVKLIRAMNIPVWATDIRDRGCPRSSVLDFFAFTKPKVRTAIVTNPPFNMVNWRDGKGAWITHALGTLEIPYMALLLPWNWPGAAGLKNVWHDYPPARVYLMRWKIDFSGQGSPPMLNAWFVWDGKQPPGSDPVLKMLDKADVRQGEMAL